MALDRKLLQNLLRTAAVNSASDIHFHSGKVPSMRVRDSLHSLKIDALSQEDMIILCTLLTDDKDFVRKAHSTPEVVGSYTIPEVGRFRFNIFRHQSFLGAVVRVIPFESPSIEDLGLSSSIQKVAGLRKGLIIVAGMAGSGKSSTIAAILHRINEKRRCHILTIEDPIEFVFTPKKARITQRNVGSDTEDYKTALEMAFKQDPNVILVSEIKNSTVMDYCLKAAESGCLVISSMHTMNAVRTLQQLTYLYPASEQRVFTYRLKESLKAIVSQRLLPHKNEKERVVLQEVMVVNQEIQKIIADGMNLYAVDNIINQSKDKFGSIGFDQHLAELYKQEKITIDVAKHVARSLEEFALAAANSQNNHASLSDGRNSHGPPQVLPQARPGEEMQPEGGAVQEMPLPPNPQMKMGGFADEPKVTFQPAPNIKTNPTIHVNEAKLPQDLKVPNLAAVEQSNSDEGIEPPEIREEVTKIPVLAPPPEVSAPDSEESSNNSMDADSEAAAQPPSDPSIPQLPDMVAATHKPGTRILSGQEKQMEQVEDYTQPVQTVKGQVEVPVERGNTKPVHLEEHSSLIESEKQGTDEEDVADQPLDVQRVAPKIKPHERVQVNKPLIAPKKPKAS